MSKSSKLRNAFCLSIFASLVLAALTPAAFAAGQSTVKCFTPQAAGGTVTLTLFFCADPQCYHGTSCNVIATIPPRPPEDLFTGEQKAALIEAAILAQCTGVGVKRNGNQLTLTNTVGNDGMKILKPGDSTGEVMLVENDGDGVPVNYFHTMTLIGTPTTGRVAYGINGNVHEVETAGKTVMDIYFELQAMMGGFVDPNGLTTDPEFGDYRSIYFQVTDPGLEIEVEEFN